MPPLIYAKSALSFDQLDVKRSIGCDGIEVQLLNELMPKDESKLYPTLSEVFNLADYSDYRVKVVHAPLLPGRGDVVLEVLCDDDFPLLDNIFKIADYFGSKPNEKVIVVLHSESYYDKLVDAGNLWDRIVDCVRIMLERYVYTELVIENVSPLRGIGNGKELHLANNFAFDNIRMVEKLREALNTDRIGVCLDTCHAMLTEKYMTALYQAVGDVPCHDFSMYKFFERCAPYVKLIHLCDIVGSGYGKGRHGVPFHSGTYIKLSHILDLYEQYNLTCPLTLEVEETDYSTCSGYINTKEQVLKYYKLLKLPTVNQLKWCRENAPLAYKDYSDAELWEAMRSTYLSIFTT